MWTGHSSGNTGETQWLQNKQGRDDTDQGFQDIKDIVVILWVEKLSSSQVVTVHWSGCTAAGIYKFLSHARALFHCSHSHVIYSCKAPQSCWTLGCKKLQKCLKCSAKCCPTHTGFNWVKAVLAHLFSAALQLKRLHIVFWCHQDFCLSAIEIWGTLLLTGSSRSSNKLVYLPWCPQVSYLVQFSHTSTHTHASNSFRAYRKNIPLPSVQYKYWDTNLKQMHKRTRLESYRNTKAPSFVLLFPAQRC